MLIQFILAIIVVGVIWGLVNRFLPLPAIVNTILTVIFVLVICVFLLQLVGINVGHGIRF